LATLIERSCRKAVSNKAFSHQQEPRSMFGESVAYPKHTTFVQIAGEGNLDE